MYRHATVPALLANSLLFAAPALAQEPATTAPDDNTPAASGDPSEDGPRRRRYTAALVGLETVRDAAGNSLTATMGGLDAAFGIQLNDTIGVYAPLHLAFGNFSSVGSVGGIPLGLTGTLAATVVVDATFADRFFVGGGGGLGVLNNPMGPALHLRAGGYPLMNRMADSNRRKGMAVALDLRMIYAQGLTATYPTLSVAYASF